MTEEKNAAGQKTPIVEPEVVRHRGAAFGSRPFGPQTFAFHWNVRSLPLLPALFGAAVGVIFGALLGALAGILGGPAGIILGLGMGALTGLFVGAGLGFLLWSWIPRFLRGALSAALIFLAADCISARFFHFNLWEKFTALFR